MQIRERLKIKNHHPGARFMTEEEVYARIEQLQGEVDRLALAYYHWKAIHSLASQHDFQTINIHSSFWAATLYSMQNTYILGLAKLFDKSASAFNLDKLITDCKTFKGYFDQRHLAARKLKENQQHGSSSWTQETADSYAAGAATFNNEADFNQLITLCDPSRKIVISHIHPIRHQIAAHTNLGITKATIEELYGAVDTDSVESVIDTAHTIGQSLYGAWINGHEFLSQVKHYPAPPHIESELVDLLDRASSR